MKILLIRANKPCMWPQLVIAASLIINAFPQLCFSSCSQSAAKQQQLKMSCPLLSSDVLQGLFLLPAVTLWLNWRKFWLKPLLLGDESYKRNSHALEPCTCRLIDLFCSKLNPFQCEIFTKILRHLLKFGAYIVKKSGWGQHKQNKKKVKVMQQLIYNTN